MLLFVVVSLLTRLASLSVWNSLPQSLRLIDDHEQFQKQLKTYYFNVAFS